MHHLNQVTHSLKVALGKKIFNF